MTVHTLPTVRRRSSASRSASLAQVLEHLGTTVLELVCGDPDRVGAVTEITYFDPLDPTPLPRDSIVLATGDRAGAWSHQVIGAAAANGAAAVILPTALRDNPETIAHAREAGLVLLAISSGTTWQQLSSLLDSALRASASTAPNGSAPNEGLFRLANAICMLIDAPVTIEDRNSNVLAFSDRQDEADFIRIDCVLGRRTIEPYLRADEERGAMRAIRRSPVPVYLDAVELDDDRPTLPRLAVAIRAGDEFLGTIWAVVQGPPPAEHEQLLLDASRTVALEMLRQQLSVDREQRTASELVAVALDGGPGTAVALARLGLADCASIVLAASVSGPEILDLRGGASSTLAHRVHERERIEYALRVHLNASTPGSVVATVNDQVYAVVPVRRPHDAALNLAHSARAFLQQHRGGAPILMGIGRLCTSPADLRLSRADADRAVRVLEEADDGRCVAHASAVDAEALLLEAREIVFARGRGPTGAFARLLAYDDARNASMIETLRAWLDAHGDVPTASAASHVHQNTFRYRLRRISEIGDFSLEDPKARFSLDLQLRLFLPRAKGEVAVHDAAQHSPDIRRNERSRAPKAEYVRSSPA